ncbi:TerC family protein [Dokdonella soli]|uniref:TerC family protein n=1 Tax=Dokdonella soli TaxID=529810 RepID=A0ABN1IVQ9_9GAMM
MNLLADPQTWIALLTLSTLEIVLGVDNLVFISIAVSRLPHVRRSSARRIGLAFACITRILLLLSLAHLARMDDRTAALFRMFGQIISIRDLVLIGGGIFLVVKGVMEILDALSAAPHEHGNGHASASFGLVIAQIALIDIVFSLDSVITAVGMINVLPVMVAAIILAVLVMIFIADPVGEFIDRNPTIRMLALAFIILVGVTLMCDGVDVHIARGYLYFAMAFSAAVESLNLLARRRHQQNAQQHARRPDQSISS